jgi:hypothetical protein
MTKEMLLMIAATTILALAVIQTIKPARTMAEDIVRLMTADAKDHPDFSAKFIKP